MLELLQFNDDLEIHDRLIRHTTTASELESFKRFDATLPLEIPEFPDKFLPLVSKLVQSR